LNGARILPAQRQRRKLRRPLKRNKPDDRDRLTKQNLVVQISCIAAGSDGRRDAWRLEKLKTTGAAIGPVRRRRAELDQLDQLCSSPIRRLLGHGRRRRSDVLRVCELSEGAIFSNDDNGALTSANIEVGAGARVYLPGPIEILGSGYIALKGAGSIIQSADGAGYSRKSGNVALAFEPYGSLPRINVLWTS
jgi:hypothetical protein